MAATTADPLGEFREVVRKTGTKCGVTRLLEEMADSERADKLRLALATDAIPSSAIETVIERWGEMHVGAYTIGRHRRGACRCGA